MMRSISSLLACLLFVCAAHAASIPIINHSFEFPDVASGGWSDEPPDGWVDTQGNTNHNFVEEIPGFVGDGLQHFGFDPNPDPQLGGFSLVYQDLPDSWQPNTLYTLTLGVGNRAGQPTGIARISLGSSTASPDVFLSTTTADTALIPEGTFQDTSVSFTTGATVPAGTVRVVLSNDEGGRVHYDNARLDATVIPEPSTFGIAVLAGAAFIGWRRRR